MNNLEPILDREYWSCALKEHERKLSNQKIKLSMVWETVHYHQKAIAELETKIETIKRLLG